MAQRKTLMEARAGRAGSLRCVWASGRRGVARAEWREFWRGRGGDFGGAGGIGIGEEHVGGVALAAFAREWTDYRGRDFAGRGGCGSNGRGGAAARAGKRGVDCFSGAVLGATSDDSGGGAGWGSFAGAWDAQQTRARRAGERDLGESVLRRCRADFFFLSA